MTTNLDHTDEVLQDVFNERVAQENQWGDGRSYSPAYPLDKNLFTNPVEREHIRAQCHGIATETEAKRACKYHFDMGMGSWFDILLEEVAEVLGAVEDPKELRKELIQVAAVCVSWVEDLDSQEENNNDGLTKCRNIFNLSQSRRRF